MRRALLVTCLALSAAACAYRPEPTDQIRIVDSPADVRVCTNLGVVNAAGIGFEDSLETMLEETVALGGTDLLLRKHEHDWRRVSGVAYRCGSGVVVRGRTVAVVRAKG